MEKNEQLANSRWHSAKSTDTVIVFVHGLLSTSDECWRNQSGLYWPNLVVDDPIFEDASVFLAGYYSDVDSGPYDFAQCSREVFESLKHRRENGRAPLDYTRIIFLAHSLGGVVVRRLLEENAHKFASKQVGVVLMASPTGGSAYAEVFSDLARIYGHSAALALNPQSEALKDIDYRFRALLAANSVSIRGIEACEHLGPLRWRWLSLRWKWLPIRLPPIVSVDSSSKYFGPPRIIRGTDHSGIVKPAGLLHPSHEFFQNFFAAHWARNLDVSSRNGNVSAVPASMENVLFNVYRPAGRPYCIVRSIDASFKNRIPLKSVWVHGVSGVGKTTLVKRYLDANGSRPLELTLGHLDQFSPEQFIQELAETINSRQELNISASQPDVVRALSRNFGQSGVVLFLDEVPVGKFSVDCERKLLVSLSALVEAVEKSGGSPLRIVVCSLAQPRLHLAGQKCSEQIELVRADLWTSRELGELVVKIEQSLPELKCSRSLKTELIKAAAGSPRVIKEFYRRRVMVTSGGESEVQSLNVVLNTLGVMPGREK